ncbi:hypothetical protein L208DRAFT_1416784 [Tricholoma matsutake]|nr:hypothetical protein L208DRAFT_1416784 [Tricholoma matsutake 945]
MVHNSELLLDDVSGYVASGKLTAVMGESGAGKVTHDCGLCPYIVLLDNSFGHPSAKLLSRGSHAYLIAKLVLNILAGLFIGVCSFVHI